MKRRLYLKLFGSFFIFAAITLIFLSTFTHDTTERYLVGKKAQELSSKASLIAADYKPYFATPEIILPESQQDIAHLSKFLSAEIWIIDTNGNILLDSSNAIVETMAHVQQPIRIEGFNVSDFGNTYYQTGHFYDYFKENTLTVFSTITNNYKVRGYVLLHMPMSEALAQAEELIDITSLSVLIVLICAFVLIFIFYIHINFIIFI